MKPSTYAVISAAVEGSRSGQAPDLPIHGDSVLPAQVPDCPSSDGTLAVAPVPLPSDHSSVRGPDRAAPTVSFVSMTWTKFPCGACGGTEALDRGKPILTVEEAAGMLGVSRKRMESIIYEEKTRLGRLPDFVCDGGGKTRRRVLAAEFMEWVRSRRARRGRPPKPGARG